MLHSFSLDKNKGMLYNIFNLSAIRHRRARKCQPLNLKNGLIICRMKFYLRLVECRTIKEDLSVLLHAKWQWAQDTGRYTNYTKADFLDEILELLDCNGLYEITEMTLKEWRDLVK